MSRRTFVIGVIAILAVAALARLSWLRADPPAVNSAGIVWHDEGPWTHSARNRVLWGQWRTDHWNPVFVAPVFTGLEYASFSAFGVGTWQARVVPAISGLAAIVFLMIGLRAAGTRGAALAGGALLATDYVFVMWNRAALMESTMTAFMVVAWACYTMAERRPAWGMAAGAAAVLAFFTKAAAAFFIAAIALDAAIVLARRLVPAPRRAAGEPTRDAVRGAVFTLGGLVGATVLIAALFVLPHWSEYQFYNWQMSVLRKPSYALRDLMDRASWMPIVQGFFTRMWPLFLASLAAVIVIATRWRSATAGERLLVGWMLLGLLELIVHDAGNERRYVMFIPAVIALAVIARRAGASAPADTVGLASTGPPDLKVRPTYVLLVLFFAYLAIGAALRPVFDESIAAGSFRLTVRLSAGAAVLVTVLIAWRWRDVLGVLDRARASTPLAAAVLVLMLGWNAWQYVAWARTRGEANYRASIDIGRLLPPGTLVHGKLANGLALENRIRPVFVGRGFGNYDDRLTRDDVRYILTYSEPTFGYESQKGLIQEILDRYPQHRVLATFDVDETPAPDRAVLIDKFR